MNKIVPAEPEHVEALVNRIRRADLDELASCGVDPMTALLMSLALSTEAFTWMHGTEVVAVFGVAPDPEHVGVGCPWMIGTDRIRREARFVIEESRALIDRFNRQYPLLENYIHPGNTASKRWLQWCGFQFGEPEPYGAKGELFLPFFKEL